MKTPIYFLIVLFCINSTFSQNIIKPEKGFTPQIGTLVSMLNDLSNRVERTASSMNQNDLDFLLDDNSNRIGSLIMHLAAVEAYYQVYTFENRGFNAEERKIWQVAMDLGVTAREKYQGKDVSYYIETLKSVRKRTIELLKTKDDKWLNDKVAGSSMNNHWAWFHVMEHQSSHLGQILLLRKKIK